MKINIKNFNQKHLDTEYFRRWDTLRDPYNRYTLEYLYRDENNSMYRHVITDLEKAIEDTMVPTEQLADGVYVYPTYELDVYEYMAQALAYLVIKYIRYKYDTDGYYSFQNALELLGIASSDFMHYFEQADRNFFKPYTKWRHELKTKSKGIDLPVFLQTGNRVDIEGKFTIKMLYMMPDLGSLNEDIEYCIHRIENVDKAVETLPEGLFMIKAPSLYSDYYTAAKSLYQTIIMRYVLYEDKADNLYGLTEEYIIAIVAFKITNKTLGDDLRQRAKLMLYLKSDYDSLEKTELIEEDSIYNEKDSPLVIDKHWNE